MVFNVDDRYFGYVDTIANVNGKKTIIDLKTRSKLGSDDNYLVETLQLMLYRDAYFYMTAEELEIALLIINKKTKTKREFIVIDTKDAPISHTFLGVGIEKKSFVSDIKMSFSDNFRVSWADCLFSSTINKNSFIKFSHTL